MPWTDPTLTGGIFTPTGAEVLAQLLREVQYTRQFIGASLFVWDDSTGDVPAIPDADDIRAWYASQTGSKRPPRWLIGLLLDNAKDAIDAVIPGGAISVFFRDSDYTTYTGPTVTGLSAFDSRNWGPIISNLRTVMEALTHAEYDPTAVGGSPMSDDQVWAEGDLATPDPSVVFSSLSNFPGYDPLSAKPGGPSAFHYEFPLLFREDSTGGDKYQWRIKTLRNVTKFTISWLIETIHDDATLDMLRFEPHAAAPECFLWIFTNLGFDPTGDAIVWKSTESRHTSYPLSYAAPGTELYRRSFDNTDAPDATIDLDDNIDVTAGATMQELREGLYLEYGAESNAPDNTSKNDWQPPPPGGSGTSESAILLGWSFHDQQAVRLRYHRDTVPVS